MSEILIIDDDPSICRILEMISQKQGHCAISATTLGQGLDVVQGEKNIDLVFLDVNLPDGNGLRNILQIKQAGSRPEVIIITGQGDEVGAQQAIESGAWDYLSKTASPNDWGKRLVRAMEYRKNQKPIMPKPCIDRRGIIGSSSELQKALDQVAQTMGSDASVLITGETGTGKELFAQAVHRNSSRKGNNFVVVDCGALPEHLIASMLFGHVKGAFTGADQSREGLIKQADGGTLYLDEIGEMPLDVQKAFLRVLDGHTFRPIGAKRESRSDFRVVAATNCDLEEMVCQGRFRKDLLYRLSTFHLKLPSLRNRKEDIKALAEFHCRRLCRLYGLPDKSVSEDFLEVLLAYGWPGNIRELVNIMDCAIATAKAEDMLFSCHIPKKLRIAFANRQLKQRTSPGVESSPLAIDPNGAFPCLQRFREHVVEQAENNYLTALMSASGGSMVKACSLSGVSRSRLYELLKRRAVATA